MGHCQGWNSPVNDGGYGALDNGGPMEGGGQEMQAWNLNSVRFALLDVLVVLVLLSWTPAGAAPAATVGAYYFEGWYHDTPGTIAAFANTELRNNFPEREPIWGGGLWRGDTVEIMEQQIDLAADHGITFFSFDWYWYGNPSRTENDGINSGLKNFMLAENRDRMKFNINIVDAGPTTIDSDADWRQVAGMLLPYLADSQYLRVGGNPLVTNFNAAGMTSANYNYFQQIAPSMGLNEVEFAANVVGSTSVYNYVTRYNAVPGWGAGEVEYPYQSLTDYLQGNVDWTNGIWNDESGGPQSYIPVVMAGWDARPWDTPPTWYFNPTRTPEAVASHLQQAIDWIDDNPTLATPERLVMIYAWNEFGEGGYIAPTVGDPSGLYLEAIKSVVLDSGPGSSCVIAECSGSWAADDSGDWSSGINWVSGLAASGVGALATFGDVITGPRTVLMEGDQVIGSIEFDSPYQYTILDRTVVSSLTVAAASGNAAIVSARGTHEFSANVITVSDLDVDVAAGSSIAFSETLPLDLNGHTLSKTGHGNVRLHNVKGGGNVIVQQGQLFFSGTHFGGGFYGVGMAGLLVAEGLILGDVINSGTFSVGPSMGGSGLVISGDFSQNDNGLIQLEISGADSYDTLSVGGTLTVGGTFRALLSGGYVPQAGDQFNLLSFGNASGAFAMLALPELAGGLIWDSSGLLTSGMLKVLTSVLFGDANNDFQVTGLDLIAVQQNFGSDYTTGACSGLGLGDANGDCLVTGLDLISTQQHFGSMLEPVGVSIPEPLSGIVLLFCGVYLLCQRVSG